MGQGGIVEIFSDVVSSSVSQIAFDLRPGLYEKLIFNFAGTNDTSQTFDPSNMGVLTIDDGRPLANIEVAVLDDLAQLKGGIMERVSTVSSTFDWFVPYRFNWFDDDRSIFAVNSGENVRVKLEPSGLSTVMGSNNLTIKVYGIYREGIMPYRLVWNRLDIDIAASTTSRKTLIDKNIIGVYLDYSSSISRVRFKQQGELVIDTDLNSLLSVTHDDNRLETYSGSFPQLELNFNRNNDITDIKNDNNEIEIDGGGTATITASIASLDFTPVALRSSLLNVRAQKTARQQAKINLGEVGSVQVDELLTDPNAV